MKKNTLLLSAVASVIAIAGVFAFKAPSHRGQGTLFTRGLSEIISCARVPSVSVCPVSAYTIGGTRVTNAFVTAE